MRRDFSALLPPVALATLVLVFLSLRLPPPKAGEAGLAEFSAIRAKRILDTVLKAPAPHPIGTAENAAVRDAIVAEARKLGYVAEVERAFVCGKNLTCATVENIVARPAGTGGGPGVFLVSHYDSVLAGPGAADDLSGVAASLEVVRALSGERHRNPVWLLITDGEEAGLLGAEAFVSSSRFANQARAVINLEARGTSGPSFLFETSDDNGWLVSRVIRALPRPSTSSLFYTVYKSLPNDTDFSVLKKRGIDGVNFAFIGSPLHYHTPIDLPSTLSLPTLQHHGENALAAARALADADLAARVAGNAVWFSLFDRVVVSWPEPWTLPLVILNLAALVLACGRLLRRGEFRLGGLASGMVWGLVSVIASGFLAWAGTKLLSLRFGDRVWLANPLPFELFVWLVSFSVTMFFATVRANRHPPSAFLSGAAAILAALSLAAGLVAPGVSFLVLVPGGVLSVALLAHGFGAPLVWGQVVATLATGTVLFPLGLMLGDALGLPAMPGIAVVVALVSLVAVPSFATGDVKRLQVAAGAVLLSIVSLFAALAVPGESERAPAPLNIVFRQSTEKSEWLIPQDALRGREDLARSAGWEAKRVPFLPWVPSASHLSAPAGRTPDEVPRVELVGESESGEARVLSLRIVSPRKARRLRVALEDGGNLQSVLVEGQRLVPLPSRDGKWLVFRHVTLPLDGTAVTVSLRKGEKLRGYAADESSGLPAEGGSLIRARGIRSTPVHDGDRTMTVAEFSF